MTSTWRGSSDFKDYSDDYDDNNNNIYSDISVNEIEDKIRVVVFQKRIRINEFFRDFDKLKTGFVSQPQFRRCLSMAGISLTNEESNALMKVYEDESRMKVNYNKFSDSIDQVFTTKKLEKAPREQLYSIKPILGATRAPRDLESDQMDTLKELLNRLKREAVIQGYFVKSYFKDFDAHNYGVVTRNQFLQCIPFRNLKENEIRMVLDRYGCNNGLDVNYLQFHDDIEGKSSQGEYGTETLKLMAAQKEQEELYAEAEAVERLLHKLLLQYHIRVDDNFRDFDPLRTGFITHNQFISCLGAIKLPRTSLSERELKAVAEKYKVHDELTEVKIAYMEFIKNMNRVFNSSTLERFPTKKFRKPTELLQTTRQTLGKEKEQLVENIIERIKHQIYTKRMLLKPFFQDFDKTQKGIYSTKHITKLRFERALSMLGFKLTQDEYDALSQKYDDLNDGTVNYTMFLEDVDEGHNNEAFGQRK